MAGKLTHSHMHKQKNKEEIFSNEIYCKVKFLSQLIIIFPCCSTQNKIGCRSSRDTVLCKIAVTFWGHRNLQIHEFKEIQERNWQKSAENHRYYF